MGIDINEEEKKFHIQIIKGMKNLELKWRMQPLS